MRFFSESIPLPDLALPMYQTLGYGESVNRRDGLSQKPLPDWQRVLNNISACWPPANCADVTVLVGVSGGADSVCLLRALNDLRPINAKGRLVVAHYNHRLRGADSDADAAFVQELAEELNLACVLGEAESRIVGATAESAGERVAPTEIHASEAQLRDQRYLFLEQTAARLGARYLALAHNRNDNIETILHNLFRGTGASGLSGIPMFRDLGPDLVIARPLLATTRETIVAGMASIEQNFRHDCTNDTDLWNRNWLRNSLLPSIRQRYPAAEEAILRAADLIDQQNVDIRMLAEAFIEASVVTSSTQIVLRNPGSPAGFIPTSPPQTVFVSALSILFDRQNWSRGSMTRRHWDGLWQIFRGPATDSLDNSLNVSLNLPGNLRASRLRDGSVVVERLASD